MLALLAACTALVSPDSGLVGWTVALAVVVFEKVLTHVK